MGLVTGGDAKAITVSQPEAERLAIQQRLSPASIKSVLYRPFDNRFIIYDGAVVTRPRTDVMKHLLAEKNIALVTSRMTKGETFQHLQATRNIVEVICMSSKTSNNGFVFPLWLFPTETEALMGMEREANLAPAFLAEAKKRIGVPPMPEDVFHYAYAVLHAPTYRTRYAAFLKTDFPRLPLPPNGETFHALAALGQKLVALHLLEDPALQQHGIGFPVPGDHTVQRMRTRDRYVAPTAGGDPGRVRLNDTEYFDNVPPEAWEFRVGGYQPAAKWLEDRAGRTLTADDITHYRHMIAAMRETAALLPQVDAAFLALMAGNIPPDAEE